MNSKSATETDATKADSLFPSITWKVTFNKLLPINEIPGELPLIEIFLNGYIRHLLGIITRRKLNIHYSWVMGRRQSRTLTLHAAINVLHQVNSSALRVEPITIIKDEDRYVLLLAGLFRPSTKNTVKLKPPSTVK